MSASGLDPAPSLQECLALFERHGGTEADYLRRHFPRFVATKQLYLAHHDRQRGNRVLDVGAHWLHQSLLYALDGFEVTALDVPATLEQDNVRRLAQAHSIRLLPNPDLEHPHALAGIADDSFDLVLFTEVIEHLAFNPVTMWREIHRVMKPGACIVLTTPNYYSLRTRVRRWLRALRLQGAGPDVDQVLSVRTFGHHWKEYSRRELVRYFSLLSPDFSCRHFRYVEEYLPTFLGRPGGRLVQWIEHAIKPLRPDVYLEVELTRKEKGITIEPHW